MFLLWCSRLERFCTVEPPCCYRTRLLGYYHMSLGWFNCTEPPQTTSLQNRIKCIGLFYMSLGWFNPNKPSLQPLYYGGNKNHKEISQVWGGSPNFFDLLHHRGTWTSCKVNKHEFGLVALQSDCFMKMTSRTAWRSKKAWWLKRYKETKPDRTREWTSEGMPGLP